MVNQRNVDALRAIIEDVREEDQASFDLAAALAARGVLVPSTLELDFRGDRWTECPLCGDDVDESSLARGRTNLERIAKGES